LQNKLETQYAAKREAHQSEVADLKQQLEMKGNEVRSLNASIDSLKSVNEELKVGSGDIVVGARTPSDFLLACFRCHIGWHRGWEEFGRECSRS
jgi:hypothetical protein